MIFQQKKLLVGIVLLASFFWLSSAWAVSFDCNALNDYSAAHIDCFGETAKTFHDESGQYSLTVDHRDVSGECNTGFDLLQFRDKDGAELWSVNVEDGTAGDYVNSNWDDMFASDIPSTVNAPTMLRVSTTRIASMISRYIAKVMESRARFAFRNRQDEDDEEKKSELESNRITGLAAGDPLSKFSLWGNAGYNSWDVDDRRTESDGYLSTLIIGADYRLTESLVLGVSLVYENSDIDTDYNNGQLDQDGFTLAPYIGVVLNDYFTLAATVGYAWLDTDQQREKGFGHDVKSSLDSTRFFGSVHLDGFYNFNHFNVTGILGCLYSQERQDSFTEDDGNRVGSNDVDLGQISIGAEISYSFAVMEPYFSTTFLYDFQYEDIDNVDYDDTAIEINPGVRFYFENGFCADIQGGVVLGRSDYDEYSVTANLRYEF
ncbi:MAG: autotransporter outer membrane beta-barrel domain-containing protein [Deltaproteobacteria bacterium]|nr:autotransporter outer membrane beta-barrel domain-containing protein [Candidatus Tharpella sp.]